MTKAVPQNMPDSVRQKLRNISKERNINYQLLLTRYGLERFLFRLSKSEHKNTFILKGALLFLVWDNSSYRPTRDIDFLGKQRRSQKELKQAFQEICKTRVKDDGIIFDARTINTERIREGLHYEGVRVKCSGKLGKVPISIQVDIGFDDVVTPRPKKIEYPTLLDSEAPKIMMYPPETVIAEKFQAMVHLGVANSRMKDFYDVGQILGQMTIKDNSLKQAIHKTFKRRKTPLPKQDPLCFSEEFWGDAEKKKQWMSFLKRNKISSENNLQGVITKIKDRLLPLIRVDMDKQK